MPLNANEAHTHCRECQTLLFPGRVRKRAIFCSNECQKRNYRRQYQGKETAETVAPSSVGAAHEMLVVAHLLLKGWAVFRAVSPACFCDLIAVKDGQTARVEVTTGYRAFSGAINYSAKDFSKFDILAVVLKATGEILYFPPLP